MTDIKPQDIEALIATFEASPWDSFSLKLDGLDMFLSKSAGASRPAHTSVAAPALAPAAAPAPARVPPTAPTTAAVPPGWVAVKAPHLGSFYRAPKPGAAPYVEIGQRVEPGAELCLIEVMKLFTSIVATVGGVVQSILAKDGELVEHDQPLFLIAPES